MRQQLQIGIALIRIIYGNPAANELQLLANIDQLGAIELINAALDPSALVLKLSIDKDDHKIANS